MVYVSQLICQQLQVRAALNALQQQPNQANSASLTRSLWPQMMAWLPCLVAVFVSVTRVVDYYHFVEDVVCGALLGAAVAFLVFQNQFTKTKDRRRSDDEGSTEQGDFLV